MQRLAETPQPLVAAKTSPVDTRTHASGRRFHVTPSWTPRQQPFLDVRWNVSSGSALSAIVHAAQFFRELRLRNCFSTYGHMVLGEGGYVFPVDVVGSAYEVGARVGQQFLDQVAVRDEAIERVTYRFPGVEYVLQARPGNNVISHSSKSIVRSRHREITPLANFIFSTIGKKGSIPKTFVYDPLMAHFRRLHSSKNNVSHVA